jgi:flagellar P-ring protein precursor FlgI
MPTMRTTLVTIAVLLAATAAPARADRIKDLTTIQGVRDNHLTGFGIIVGLDGTGDDPRSPVTKTALTKMLKQLGVTIDPADLKAKNVAAVAITTALPAFARPGQELDITVSSLGNAKSLAGGTLLQAPIKGPDGKTWALAQGTLSVGGFGAEGASGSSSKTNHLTVGTIPGGAIVEAGAPTVLPQKEIVLVLAKADFTTATRMREAIEKKLGAGSAKTRDGGAVIVPISAEQRADVAALIASIEDIEVMPDVEAKVIIDERTGTIVVGEKVSLRPAAIAFGALTVEIGESEDVSQPDAPFGSGSTKVTKRSDVKVSQPDGPLHVLGSAGTVGDVAAALTALGAKPRDLVSILRALKAAGALRAELETL